MMKKILVVFMLLLACFSAHCIAYAEDEIKVYINGEIVNFDSAPQVINDSTIVPMRKIFEILGATVEWDDATQTVYAIKGEDKATVKIGSQTMNFNGRNVKLSVEPQLINEYTYVPLRAISEAFGATVNWGEVNQIVTISTDGIPVYPEIYNVPDIGAIWGVPVRNYKAYPDTNTFVYTYSFDDVYQLAVDDPQKYDSYLDHLKKYGYQQVARRTDASYDPDYTFLFGNPSNDKYFVRLLVGVLDENNNATVIVEVEPAKRLYSTNTSFISVPSSEADLYASDTPYTNEKQYLNKEYWVHKRALKEITGKSSTATFEKIKVWDIASLEIVDTSIITKKILSYYVEHNGTIYECKVDDEISLDSLFDSLNDSLYDTPSVLDVYPKEYYNFNDEEWENVQRGVAFIGISLKEFLAIKGAPDDVNTTVTQYGTYEQYIYKDKYSSDYYYFTDGILTDYQY